MQAYKSWVRVRLWLAKNPGRFAGGSAVNTPLALLAVEEERLATRERSATAQFVAASDPGSWEPHVGGPPDIPKP
jgi:hypothetical protein